MAAIPDARSRGCKRCGTARELTRTRRAPAGSDPADEHLYHAAFDQHRAIDDGIELEPGFVGLHKASRPLDPKAAFRAASSPVATSERAPMVRTCRIKSARRWKLDASLPPDSAGCKSRKLMGAWFDRRQAMR